MVKISQKQQKILAILLENGELSSSSVQEIFARKIEEISLVTIKRTLSKMVEMDILSVVGSGRTTRYKISSMGRVFADIDPRQYTSIEPDKRYGFNHYNFELLQNFPKDIFSENELNILDTATLEYKRRTDDLSETIQKKELERLIIELSWKSSKIEGNTYTLLDTEKLILENKEAIGHNKLEAKMILNHKDAFNFIYKHRDKFKTLTNVNMEEVHALLVKDMGVGFGLRSKPVGVLGSSYSPLDNVHQIKEAVDALSKAVDEARAPYAKAMLALLGISYIQPFEDGNKRTARLICNAILFAYGLAPLSYRSVLEVDYREAILVFYEINSIVPFKKIFVSQYDFAARNYAVK